MYYQKLNTKRRGFICLFYLNVYQENNGVRVNPKSSDEREISNSCDEHASDVHAHPEFLNGQQTKAKDFAEERDISVQEKSNLRHPQPKKSIRSLIRNTLVKSLRMDKPLRNLTMGKQ